MASKHKRTQRQRSRKPELNSNEKRGNLESRSSEAVTVCWGVTLTILVVCNLITMAAHLYASQNPDADRTAIVGELMLLAGSLVGAISLLLLPVVYWVRTQPPPRGVTVFGACLAISPILGLFLKSLQ